MLEKYKQQRYDLDKISPTQMLGIFHLKLQSIKNVAKPTCDNLLELLEKTMVRFVLKFYMELFIFDFISYFFMSI